MATKRAKAAEPKIETAAEPAAPKQRQVKWEWWPIDKVIPYERNARIHAPAQVEQIAASIREFGWRQAILVDKAGVIIAGHGRLEGGRAAGEALVPVIVNRDLTDAQVKALRIADNKIAENSTWDDQLLALEVAELADVKFDLSLTGFSMEALDAMLAGDDALVPIEVENGAGASGVKVQSLKWGKYEVPLSADEIVMLEQRLEGHVSRTGSRYGFVRSVIGGADAAS